MVSFLCQIQDNNVDKTCVAYVKQRLTAKPQKRKLGVFLTCTPVFQNIIQIFVAPSTEIN